MILPPDGCDALMATWWSSYSTLEVAVESKISKLLKPAGFFFPPESRCALIGDLVEQIKDGFSAVFFPEGPG